MKNKITYYDFSNLLYSSFFLAGFSQNEEKFQYKLVISNEVPELADVLSPLEKWTEALYGISLFKVEMDNEEFHFCIDLLDSSEYFHKPLLKRVKYYFKVNYHQDAIQKDAVLSGYNNKIFSASCFFPVQVSPLYLFFPRLFQDRKSGWTMKRILHRANLLRHLISLDEMRQWRNNIKKDLDIFFVQRFYGEKIHEPGMEFRLQIMKAIRKCRGISAVFGFAEGGDNLVGEFSEFKVKGYRLREYLKNMARARVSIYVRGAHDCLSFKLGKELALGKPVVGQTIANNKERFYSQKLFAEQFAYDDPDEIVRQALGLLDNRMKMDELSRSNADIFDKVFAPHVASAEILKRVLGHIAN